MAILKRSPFFWHILFNALTLALVALMLKGYGAWAASHATGEGGNTVVPFQGTLTDDEGQPLNGQMEMTFRLYNVPDGGTPVWEETYQGNNAVPVENGLFQVNLGSLNPIPADVWQTPPLYLGVQVGSDPEMTPRPVIGSVPYALHVATNAVSSASVIDGSLTRNDFAPFTGVVWKVPPTIIVETVAWTPSDNAVWDIGTMLDEAGVPSDAEVLLLGWRPSRLSDVSYFQFLDANDNVLATIQLGTNIDNTWSAIGIEYGTIIPVPGNTRKIKYKSNGGDYRDATHPRRLLIIFGWK